MQTNEQNSPQGQDNEQNQESGNVDTTQNGDQLGENEGDSALEKGNEPNVQDKPDGPRVPTVTPDNDSGDPGPSVESPSSNKAGPSDENL